jgi:hypothetical protein
LDPMSATLVRNASWEIDAPLLAKGPPEPAT